MSSPEVKESFRLLVSILEGLRDEQVETKSLVRGLQVVLVEWHDDNESRFQRLEADNARLHERLAAAERQLESRPPPRAS